MAAATAMAAGHNSLEVLRRSSSRPSGRQLDALEAQLLGLISAHQVQTTAALREADKLAEHSAKASEARIDDVERRQLQLEQQLAELAAVILELREERRSEPHAALPEREANERRRQAETCRGRAAESGASPSRSAQRAPPSRCELPEQPGTMTAGDTALLAVQELESMLRTEIKAITKRCDLLQDTLDERVLLPLRDAERRVADQEQMARQLSVSLQDCSSCVEEHEFRLGVVRTKLDVHDQKLSRLEAARWSNGRGGNGGLATTSSFDPERTPDAACSGAGLVGFGAPGLGCSPAGSSSAEERTWGLRS